jgi:2-methylisocitrate lyase-like PEP mutase family enzyme
MFEGGRTPLVPAADLADLGYRLMIMPSDLQRAAIRAMQIVAETLLHERSSARVRDQLASFADREEVVSLAEWTALDKRYAEDL